MCWEEVDVKSFHGPTIIGETSAKVKLAYDRLRTSQSRQKSYSDNRRKDLEFQVGDMVFLKVSPMKDTIRFGQKGKLLSRYVGPLEIRSRVGDLV